jgi:hypothetical protein
MNDLTVCTIQSGRASDGKAACLFTIIRETGR